MRLKSDPVINISLPDYDFIHADSVTNAGGVAVYKFEISHGLEMKLNGCEEL